MADTCSTASHCIKECSSTDLAVLEKFLGQIYCGLHWHKSGVMPAESATPSSFCLCNRRAESGSTSVLLKVAAIRSG